MVENRSWFSLLFSGPLGHPPFLDKPIFQVFWMSITWFQTVTQPETNWRVDVSQRWFRKTHAEKWEPAAPETSTAGWLKVESNFMTNAFSAPDVGSKNGATVSRFSPWATVNTVNTSWHQVIEKNHGTTRHHQRSLARWHLRPRENPWKIPRALNLEFLWPFWGGGYEQNNSGDIWWCHPTRSGNGQNLCIGIFHQNRISVGSKLGAGAPNYDTLRLFQWHVFSWDFGSCQPFPTSSNKQIRWDPCTICPGSQAQIKWVVHQIPLGNGCFTKSLPVWRFCQSIQNGSHWCEYGSWMVQEVSR